MEPMNIDGQMKNIRDAELRKNARRTSRKRRGNTER